MSAVIETRPSVTTRVEPRPLLAALTLCQRELVRFVRQRNRLIGAVGQPILFWALFGAGFGNSFQPAGVDSPQSFSQFFFPGTLAMIVLFTAIFTTISVIEERREGFLQGVLVAPVPRWAMVLGKISGGALIALFEGLIFLALGLFVGVRPTPVALALLVLMLALISVALTALGFFFAWRTDSSQGYHAVMSLILFPMWLLSGAFFPAQSPWLAWLMALNPLTYGVAGLRRLIYLGVENPPLPAGLPSLAVCWTMTILFAVAAYAAAWWITTRPNKVDLV